MGIDYRIDFFHFIKDEEGGDLRVINIITSDVDGWCPFNHNKDHTTHFGCYFSFRKVKELQEALEDYKALFIFLQIDPTENKHLEEIIEILNRPSFISNLKLFKQHLEDIKEFISFYQKKFYDIVNKFTCLESVRLGQSIRCFRIHSYYAAIILAVTGIESRLHTLIRNKHKKLYESEIQDAPIGKIVALRDPDQYKEPKYKKIKEFLRKIIPEKHVPLIKLLNTYRIVSAHPKLEEVDYNLTNSIISLSFAFILDKNITLPKKLLNLHGGAPAY